MPALRPITALIGGLAFTAFSPAAFAGCGGYAGQPANACNPGAVYSASPYQTSPVQVAYGQPYDYLKNVGFKQTPNVNVLRVQSGPALAPLSGAPSAFWGGCSNSAGAPSPYCGAPAARPVYAAQPAYSPAPVAAPAPAPVSYGNASSAQGHAYVSYNTIVHRVPPVVATPSEASVLRSRQTTSYASSSYGTSYGASSTGGWKQVSGPTVVDGMMATQVLCKQPDPAPARTQVTQSYQVVRPVVQVGYPVPVAVRGNVCAAPQRGARGRYGY